MIHPFAANGVLVRIVAIDLHRHVTVRIAGIQTAAGHELGILVDRLLQVARGIRDETRVAIVIYQLYGRAVHRLVKDVAVAGGSCKVFAEFFLYESFIDPNRC